MTPENFKLKAPCVSCPFMRGGVKHGPESALGYAAHLTFGRGATFPCHRTVDPAQDRSKWQPWGEGQQMCAGGLIFAEKVGHRSETTQALVDAGLHDVESLNDIKGEVFGAVDEMLKYHSENN